MADSGTHPAAVAGADRTVIPLPSLRRERAQRASLLLDVVTAVVLGMAGWDSLHAGHVAIGWASIGAGLSMVAAAIHELRRSHTSRGFHAYAEVAAIGMALVEAWHKHAGGKFPGASSALALVLTLRLVFADRLRGLRRSEFDGRGVFVRTSPFRSFRLDWKDVARVDFEAGSVTFTTVGGTTHRVVLALIRDGARVGEEMRAAVSLWRPEPVQLDPAP
ncbi:MAG: hypothetical protein NTY35_13145 [Planctomycetota bacterium]|nr:hypothetical protein [Planctomycetota bacterium]